jgi:hypothetical protein
MGSHRADLLQCLDHVLAQLGSVLKSLQRDKPGLEGHDLQKRRMQYWALRKTLLEADREALKTLTRASSRLATHFELLTCAAAHRISFDVHVCAPYRVSIAERPGCLTLASLHHWFPCLGASRTLIPDLPPPFPLLPNSHSAFRLPTT